MTDSIDKLLSISSEGFCGSEASYFKPNGSVASALVKALFKMLGQKNGFYAFECALHVFPSNCAELVDLETWNSDQLWKNKYESAVSDLFCFAEDIFGEQFALKGENIVRFDPETAGSEVIANSLEQWAQKILDDYDDETGYPWASEWQEKFGPLEIGMRLVPKIPFILGGAYDLNNLFALEAAESMSYRADIWRQIKNLPPGTKVNLEVVGLEGE